MARTKFRVLVNKTANDLKVDENLVNFIVRFHWNKAFELFNTLDYWTIYLENVGTIWTTRKKCERYIENLESIIYKLKTTPEVFEKNKIYSVEDIPILEGYIHKIRLIQAKAMADRAAKKEFKRIRMEEYNIHFKKHSIYKNKNGKRYKWDGKKMEAIVEESGVPVFIYYPKKEDFELIETTMKE